MSQNINQPATTPAASNGTLLARKIIIAALVIHFFSLFFLYQDDTSWGQLLIGPDFSTEGIYHFGPPPQRGFRRKPFAVFIIIGLLIVYGSSLYRKPFWDRHGYWITLVLIFFGAMGGAIVRTNGGRLSLISFILLCIAAYIHRKARRQQPAT